MYISVEEYYFDLYDLFVGNRKFIDIKGKFLSFDKKSMMMIGDGIRRERV